MRTFLLECKFQDGASISDDATDRADVDDRGDADGRAEANGRAEPDTPSADASLVAALQGKSRELRTERDALMNQVPTGSALSVEARPSTRWVRNMQIFRRRETYLTERTAHLFTTQ